MIDTCSKQDLPTAPTRQKDREARAKSDFFKGVSIGILVGVLPYISELVFKLF